jgi:hypothetical protein
MGKTNKEDALVVSWRCCPQVLGTRQGGQPRACRSGEARRTVLALYETEGGRECGTTQYFGRFILSDYYCRRRRNVNDTQSRGGLCDRLRWEWFLSLFGHGEVSLDMTQLGSSD